MTTDPGSQNKLPSHVAIIMDGNGRWARTRGLSRIQGHREGAEAVRRVVRACRERGISWLTLYAFSEENWRRPKKEIGALMALLSRFLKSEREELKDKGIRLRTMGRTDKLPPSTLRTLLETVSLTSRNEDMQLTVALSYGGRQEISDAFVKIAEQVRLGGIDPGDISENLIGRYLYIPEMPEPDLLIRTSGEQRISNFMLWQTAYTEFHTTPCLWPDFGEKELQAALEDFKGRARRFGGV